MPRPVREPNLQLQMLIDEAGFSHKGIARRVNDLGRAKGIPSLSYDHSSVIRWLKGEHPRGPVPALIAEVLSMSLGRRITPAELGFPATRELPDLGLRFSPSWCDTIETITSLWRSDVERRQFIIDSVFAAGAYATSAIRWLTAPLPIQILQPNRQGRLVGLMSMRSEKLRKPSSGSTTCLEAGGRGPRLCATCTTKWRRFCAKADTPMQSVRNSSLRRPN
jgi:hypothetical protein